MTSPLLALFVRSLREGTRGKATYWARGGLGTFLLIVVFISAANARWTGAPGKDFFNWIVILQMVAVTFVGLSYFASAVAEEKEDETLGLLRMTNLSPLSILLGKSTSRLGGALLLLTGQVPFTIFAITLGGISLGQIAAAYCTMVAFTFLLCNMALLASVLARTTAVAASFCVLALIVLLGIGPALGALHDTLADHGWPTRLDRVGAVLWDATPPARLEEVLTTGFSGAPVGWQVATNLALGVGCFLLAWALFERFCDRSPETAASAGPQSRFLGMRLSRPPRVWNRALVWKDFYFLCGGRVGFGIRLLGYGGALATLLWQIWRWKMTGMYGRIGLGGITQVVSALLSFIFSVDAAWMAARMFGVEWRDQTLGALFMLPGTIRQIAYRKAFACLLASIPGLVATGTILILMVVSSNLPAAGPATGFSIRGLMVMQSVGSVVALILVVHVVACLSLYMKRGALPVGYAVTYAARMVVMMICMTLLAASMFGSGAMSNMAFIYMYLSPAISMGASLVATVILHIHIRRRLEALAGEG